MYAVYVLIDPLDNLIRYVGIAENVYTRFVQHINCEGRNYEKNLWVAGCRAKNTLIQMKTIDYVETKEEALEMEKKWIEYYLSLDMPLFNKTIAGEVRRKRAEEEAKREKLAQECDVLERRANELVTRIAQQESEIAKQEEHLAHIKQIRHQLADAPVIQIKKRMREESRSKILTQALEAWKSGHRSRRALAKHLDITVYQADLLCKDIESALGLDNSGRLDSESSVSIRIDTGIIHHNQV